MWFSFGYAFTSALAVVFVHYVITEGVATPIASIAFMSLTAILVFHALNIRRTAYVYKTLLKHKKRFLSLNLVSCAVWVASFYGVYYAGANQYIFVMFLTVSLIPTFLVQDYSKLMAIVFAYGLFLVLHRSEPLVLLGSLISLSSGISAYFTFRESEKFFRETGFRALDVLSVRFYLLFFFSASLSTRELISLPPHAMGFLVLLALITIVVPIFCSQKAVQCVGTQRHSRLVSLTPVMTYLIILALFNERALFTMLGLSLLAAVVLNWDIFSPVVMTRKVRSFVLRSRR